MVNVLRPTGMRRIDLTCLILAPIAVGCLMTFAGPRAAVAAICAWNLAAWAPECGLLRYSMGQVPHLRYTFLPVELPTGLRVVLPGEFAR